ncbi:MAG: hypothetical protein JXA95_18505 [Spirochaetales bacterium]|nr:hypothetical protein [Spirochaetales bacterium]
MKECEVCGAKYDINIILLPDMDKDQINCAYCGEPLKVWCGAYMYIARRKSGPTKEYTKRGLLAKSRECADHEKISKLSKLLEL